MRFSVKNAQLLKHCITVLSTEGVKPVYMLLRSSRYTYIGQPQNLAMVEKKSQDTALCLIRYHNIFITLLYHPRQGSRNGIAKNCLKTGIFAQNCHFTILKFVWPMCKFASNAFYLEGRHLWLIFFILDRTIQYQAPSNKQHKKT